MLLSPEPASPVKSGEPLKTMARRVPCGFIVPSMCCRKRKEPSLMRGRPAPKRPLKPRPSASSRTTFSCGFHSTPKGGLASRQSNVRPAWPTPVMWLSTFSWASALLRRPVVCRAWCLARTSALVGSSTQSRRRSTVSGRMTRPYCAGL
jgi:hypothetical protein